MADLPNATQLRDALAWLTQDQKPTDTSESSIWRWFWEAVQGDFNDNRSTKQIAFDAAISMIPLVDQVCDVRDLIANSKAIVQAKDEDTTRWNWLSLILTLIGFFPSLGSLVKGVLKIFFMQIRKHGANKVGEAVEAAMTWVITLLRKQDVQRYLRAKKVDAVFKWLADAVRSLRGKVNKATLLAAFDQGIKVMTALAEKVSWMPTVGAKVKKTVEMVRDVRKQADRMIEPGIKPLQDILDRIIQRLDQEQLVYRSGIVNANNVHFRGGLPETTAVALMKKEPPPSWLSEGKRGKWTQLEPVNERAQVSLQVKKGWPDLTDTNIESFHRLAAAEIKGPARLYRILAPNSRAMSDCWISEEIYKRIQASPNPRAAWRKYLGVWPDWNVNGQFVIYDVKPGETLKVWRGEASSQIKKDLPGKHLEGGWEQIVFKVPRGDAANDTMRYYKLGGGEGTRLQKPMTQAEYSKSMVGMSKEQIAQFEAQHIGLREQINHPNISGPFDTGWGYFDDFADAAMPARIGLPSLPGQASQLNK
jgi:hypothetical protein